MPNSWTTMWLWAQAGVSPGASQKRGAGGLGSYLGLIRLLAESSSCQQQVRGPRFLAGGQPFSAPRGRPRAFSHDASTGKPAVVT